MKRKLSMTLAIILVTTSFIGCDENSVVEEQDFVQEIIPQDIPNESK